MIERGSLVLWKRETPWRDDVQIEQDLVLSRALVELYRNDVVAETCTLRGGTALNKLVFRPAARYSEDIDLVQEIPGPIGPLLDAVRDCITPWLGRPKVERLTRGTTLMWRFETNTVPVQRSRLKLEINTREHGWVGTPMRVPFEVANPWFTGSAEVNTVPLEDLLATKVRALYQRRKGRDLFDLQIALERFPGLDLPRVLRGFHTVMDREGHPVSWRELELNLRAKLTHALFGADVAPLLVDGRFDAHEAWEFLSPRLQAAWSAA